MKWIKENKLTSAGILFGTITAFFIMLDSAFDFWEEHIAIASNDKVQIEKPENTLPDYVEYKDRTLFKNKSEGAK